MKYIDYEDKQIEISIHKIEPFFNKCKVTGVLEECNITIKYKPRNRILEIGSFRDYFKKDFNDYIEDICFDTYTKIYQLLNPYELEVIIYLDEKTLTPWEVKKSSKE